MANFKQIAGAKTDCSSTCQNCSDFSLRCGGATFFISHAGGDSGLTSFNPIYAPCMRYLRLDYDFDSPRPDDFVAYCTDIGGITLTVFRLGCRTLNGTVYVPVPATTVTIQADIVPNCDGGGPGTLWNFQLYDE